MESLKKAWLARDWNGSLWIYSEKPYKICSESKCWESDSFYERIEDNEETTETHKVKREDEEPTEVELVIKILSK